MTQIHTKLKTPSIYDNNICTFHALFRAEIAQESVQIESPEGYISLGGGGGMFQYSCAFIVFRKQVFKKLCYDLLMIF